MLKYTKEQAQAYMQQFDDMRVDGAGMFEEVYTHQKYGSFASARIVAHINSMPQPLRDPLIVDAEIGESWIEANKHQDVSMERVEAMPDSVLNIPVLLIEVAPGDFIIGDGHHRLRKAILAGNQVIKCMLAPNFIAEQFRVKIMLHRKDNDTWEEQDNEMNLAYMMGQFHHHKWY